MRKRLLGQLAFAGLITFCYRCGATGAQPLKSIPPQDLCKRCLDLLNRRLK
jgi:hypothetical protein